MNKRPGKNLSTHYGDPLLDEAPTQLAFGALVGISQPAVSALLRRGVLRPGDTGAKWLRAYCRHLEHEASATENPSHPLTMARSELLSIRIKQVQAVFDAKAGDFAPPALVRRVLGLYMQMTGEHLGKLPAEIDAAVPGLDAAARKVIADATAAVDKTLGTATALFDRLVGGEEETEDDDD